MCLNMDVVYIWILYSVLSSIFMSEVHALYKYFIITIINLIWLKREQKQMAQGKEAFDVLFTQSDLFPLAAGWLRQPENLNWPVAVLGNAILEPGTRTLHVKLTHTSDVLLKAMDDHWYHNCYVCLTIGWLLCLFLCFTAESSKKESVRLLLLLLSATASNSLKDTLFLYIQAPTFWLHGLFFCFVFNFSKRLDFNSWVQFPGSSTVPEIIVQVFVKQGGAQPINHSELQ